MSASRVQHWPAGVTVDLETVELWWLYDDRYPGQVEKFDWNDPQGGRLVPWADVPADVRLALVQGG